MALACIDVLSGLGPALRSGILNAVHTAVVLALRVPADDPTVHLVEHERVNVVVPPQRSDRYTIVTVTMFAGRSTATKRRLYELIVANLVNEGVPADDVLIVVHEPEMANWGIAGLPASEVDVGFAVEI